MRILNLVLLILVLPLTLQAAEAAGEVKTEDIILRQLEEIDLSELQNQVNKINRGVEDFLPQLSPRELILAFVKGELELGWRELILTLIKYLGKEVTANFQILGQIIILTIISAVLSIFHKSFSSETISNAANMLIFLILAILLLQSFRLAMSIAVEAIDNMVSFMHALLPVLLSLLVSVGALTSAAIFNPLTYLIISLFSTAIKYMILPMIFMSMVLSIVTNINDEFSFSRLSGVFKEFSLGLLGLMLLLFVGGLLLQGGAAAVSDSLSLRTAKHLTKTFVPVVGGIFADALDLIVSASLIIKNALNILGVIGILMIIAYPVIKIIALIIIYKLASALIQPIADQRLVNTFNELGNSLTFVFVIVGSVSLMFFMIITVVVGTANLTAMMR